MLKKQNLTQTVLAIILTYIFTTASTLAFAAEAASSSAKQQPSIIGNIGLMAILFGAMYFLMIKPQNKRAREHQVLLSNIMSGDEVITSGGLLGKVHKIVDQFLILTIAEGIEVTIQKQAIIQVLPKGTIKSL